MLRSVGVTCKLSKHITKLRVSKLIGKYEVYLRYHKSIKSPQYT